MQEATGGEELHIFASIISIISYVRACCVGGRHAQAAVSQSFGPSAVRSRLSGSERSKLKPSRSQPPTFSAARRSWLCCRPSSRRCTSSPRTPGRSSKSSPMSSLERSKSLPLRGSARSDPRSVSALVLHRLCKDVFRGRLMIRRPFKFRIALLTVRVPGFLHRAAHTPPLMRIRMTRRKERMGQQQKRQLRIPA